MYLFTTHTHTHKERKGKIKQTKQKIIYYDQVGFIPERPRWSSRSKPVHVKHNKNKLRTKARVIISADAEKAFGKFNMYLW